MPLKTTHFATIGMAALVSASSFTGCGDTTLATETFDAPGAAAAPEEAPRSLTTSLEAGVIVRSVVVEGGGVQTEVLNEDGATSTRLAAAWYSPEAGEWLYTVLRSSDAAGAARGPVTVERIDEPPSLAALNERLVDRWRAGGGPDDQPPLADYGAPGCDGLDWWIRGDQHCAQDCCASIDACFALYGCRAEHWFKQRGATLPKNIPDLQAIACQSCMIMGVTCVGACGLTPADRRNELDNGCPSGQHRCFDERCMSPWNDFLETGTVSAEFYCAENCYTAPSPCDEKFPGEVWCSGEDNEDNACRDAYGRQGFYAPSCSPTSTVTTCECERQGLHRCKDDSCAAGRRGYCSSGSGNPAADRYGGCNPKETNNPCCGDPGQPCCDGVCEGEDVECQGSRNPECVRCGYIGEPPCKDGCDGHLVLEDGLCMPDCGELGEDCCGGVCERGLVCTHPTNKNGLCGFWDLTCANDPGADYCKGTEFNMICADVPPPTSEFVCKPCGGQGQLCCNGQTCDDGLRCDGNCKAMPAGQEPDDPGVGGSTPPDLVVDIGDAWNCEGGQASITNRGGTASGPFTVGANRLGACPLTSPIPVGTAYLCPSLAPGHSILLALCEEQFSFLPNDCAEVGWHIIVDTLETVRESRELNNTATCSVL